MNDSVRLLATCAHEIRTPLNVIQCATELLKGADRETVEEMRLMIKQQVGQISHLLGDLTDLTSIQTGKIQLNVRSISANEAILKSVNAVKVSKTAADHEIVISPDTPAVDVLADPVRLQQILTNLLTNACKYSGKKSRIEIGAEVNYDRVTFFVSDNGKGLKSEFIPKIFDPFVQGETSKGGFGLGLSLVKSLAESMSGHVSAFSDGIGKGSCFYVNLPLAESIYHKVG